METELFKIYLSQFVSLGGVILLKTKITRNGVSNSQGLQNRYLGSSFQKKKIGIITNPKFFILKCYLLFASPRPKTVLLPLQIHNGISTVIDCGYFQNFYLQFYPVSLIISFYNLHFWGKKHTIIYHSLNL